MRAAGRLHGPGSRAGSRWPAPSFEVWLGTAAAITILAATVLTLTHLTDRYQVDHVAGARMALAMAADDGTLYPPLYDGTNFGGTRFMPIPIVLHTAIAKVSGEYLISGKLGSLLSTVLLLALVYVALRRAGCSRSPASALTAVILATQTGFEQAAGITGDALPAALQLGAILVIVRTDRRRGPILAGILCALALFSKLNAVWAAAAIIGWLIVYRRRHLSSFVVTYGAAVLVTTVAFGALTGGRLFENVLQLAFAGVAGGSSLLRPLLIVPLLTAHAVAIWSLLPLSLIEIVQQARARSVHLTSFSLLTATLVTVASFTAVGVNYNHLLDLVVLAAIVTGHLWVRVSRERESHRLPRLLVASLILWGLLASAVLGVSVRQASPTGGAGGGGSEAAAPLRGILGRDVSMLSEDPAVPVLYGQTPVVLDPFMLVRIAHEHPEWAAELVRRIEHREFEWIVLLHPIDAPRPADWYEVLSLGPAVAEAISRHYEIDRVNRRGEVLVPIEGRYFLYRPRPT